MPASCSFRSRSAVAGADRAKAGTFAEAAKSVRLFVDAAAKAQPDSKPLAYLAARLSTDARAEETLPALFGIYRLGYEPDKRGHIKLDGEFDGLPGHDAAASETDCHLFVVIAVKPAQGDVDLA